MCVVQELYHKTIYLWLKRLTSVVLTGSFKCQQGLSVLSGYSSFSPPMSALAIGCGIPAHMFMIGTQPQTLLKQPESGLLWGLLSTLPSGALPGDI